MPGWRTRLSRLVWPDARPLADGVTVVAHDWLAVLGGSDKVAAELADLTGADVIVTFAVSDECVDALDLSVPVVTWRFGRWAGRSRRFALMLPIMPFVWWALDVGRPSLVVTSSHSCVNALRSPGVRRVSYCHTPMRYAWAWRSERGRLPRPLRPFLPVLAAVFRRLDRRWSRRVDRYVANSTFVAGRIREAYGAESVVVPPPIPTDRFLTVPLREPSDDAPFITAGRWVPYKRFDLAIAAANRTGQPLVVAGDGPERDRLVALAGPTVEFVDHPDDETLAELLAGARAFLFCGVEDFGMLPVEAQACGTPVIARREGGALDSVVEGVTGEFVATDGIDDWAGALAHFDASRYDRQAVRDRAVGYDTEHFRVRMRDILAGSGR